MDDSHSQPEEPIRDPRLQALLDKQEIEEVVLRYCRGIDRRDLELVRGCYHEDALDHHGSFSGSVEEYITWVDPLLARYRFTQHFVGNLLIDLEATDSDARVSVAACETYGVSIHRSAEQKPYLNLATGFRYLDRFERRRNQWRIAERTAVGVWSMKLPADGWWEIPEAQQMDRRDSHDPLYHLLASVLQKKASAASE